MSSKSSKKLLSPPVLQVSCQKQPQLQKAKPVFQPIKSFDNPNHFKTDKVQIRPPDFKGFISALGNEDSVAIYKFFDLAVSDDRVLLTEEHCMKTLAMIASSKSKKYDEQLKAVVQIMELQQIPWTSEYCNLLLKAYSRIKNYDDMSRILRDMEIRGVNFDLNLYNRIIGTLPPHEFPDIVTIHDRMIKEGFEPNSETYSLMFTKCNPEHGNWALETFPVLLKNNKVTPHILNRMLNLYFSLGKFQEAENLADKIIQEDGLNLFTGTSIMKGFLKIGDYDKILDIQRKLEEKGIQLDAFAYTIVFDALEKSGKGNQIFEIFDQKQKKGLLINLYLLEQLCILACNMGDIDRALELVQSARSAHIVVSDSAYIKLLTTLCEKNMYDIALEHVIHAMKAEEPSIELCKKCLIVAAYAMNMDCLKKIWEKLKTLYKSDGESFALMIEACIRIGDSKAAWSVFQEMSSNIQLDPEIIISLIQTCASERNYEIALRCIGLLRNASLVDYESVIHIVKTHSKSFESTLAQLCGNSEQIEFFNTSQNRKLVISIYRELLLSEANISEVTFQLMLRAYIAEADLIGVVKIWTSLIKAYPNPDPDSTFLLIKATNTLGKARTAIAVYDMIEKGKYKLKKQGYLELVLLCSRHKLENELLSVLVDMINANITIDFEIYRTIELNSPNRKIPITIAEFFEETFPEVIETYQIHQESQRNIRNSLIP